MHFANDNIKPKIKENENENKTENRKEKTSPETVVGSQRHWLNTRTLPAWQRFSLRFPSVLLPAVQYIQLKFFLSLVLSFVCWLLLLLQLRCKEEDFFLCSHFIRLIMILNATTIANIRLADGLIVFVRLYAMNSATFQMVFRFCF